MEKLIKEPHLLMALDFGGSGLKAIYQVDESKPQTLFMESHTFTTDLKSLKEKTDSAINISEPENIAWVGFNNVFTAVGFLAANRYLSNQSLAKKKYSLAFYRTLAAIWVIKEKLKLVNFRLSLGVILPPGEFEDGNELCALVSKACTTGFITPSGLIKVELSFIQCFPEGAGVCSLHSIKNRQIVKQRTTGVIMLGYRNASILFNYRGSLDFGRTSNLGMVRFIELVQQKTSGLTTEALLQAIASAGSSMAPIKFYPLTERDATMERRQNEIKKIIEAVKTSKAEYLTALKAWLYDVLPTSGLDEIVFCGGTADYLKDDLSDFFPGIPLDWHPGFNLQPTWEHQWLGNRLADVYGVNKMLVAKTLKKAVAT